MRVRAYNRQDRILKLLKEETESDVGTIAKKFNVSLATARRDLTILEKEGKLLRTFGGARAKEEPSIVVKTFGEKQTVMNRAKMKIARAAMRLIKPGMKLIIDSGTTAWTISRLIKDIAPLTVITSSMAVLEELGSQKGITVFCSGGRFRPANLDFCGPQARATFALFAADIALVGVDQLIPGRGGYANDQESAGMIQTMSQYAAKSVVVADHDKIGSSGLVLALTDEKIDIIITDVGISAAHRRQLAKGPYELIVAE
jgi:DeoR family transcriptional regulator of aga operon